MNSVGVPRAAREGCVHVLHINERVDVHLSYKVVHLMIIPRFLCGTVGCYTVPDLIFALAKQRLAQMNKVLVWYVRSCIHVHVKLLNMFS